MSLTVEELTKMTAKEYEERRTEIMQALADGSIEPQQGNGDPKWLRELRLKIANMSPEQYEKERADILLELSQRRYNPERFEGEEESK